MKSGGINLLKVVDVPAQDQATLIKMGFGDILKAPGSTAMKTTTKNAINLDLEKTDALQATTIQLRFVCFKAPQGQVEMAPPKRLFF